jgi:hypothetical protein
MTQFAICRIPSHRRRPFWRQIESHDSLQIGHHIYIKHIIVPICAHHLPCMADSRFLHYDIPDWEADSFILPLSKTDLKGWFEPGLCPIPKVRHIFPTIVLLNTYAHMRICVYITQYICVYAYLRIYSYLPNNRYFL